MQLPTITRYALFICFLLANTACFGRTDSVAHSDEGRFYIKAGAGACTSLWVNKGFFSGGKKLAQQPNLSINGSVQYFLSRDVAIGLGAGYSDFSLESTFALDASNGSSHTRYAYKTTSVAAECLLIIDHIYHTSRILYSTAAVGMMHTDGVEEQDSHDQSGTLTNWYSNNVHNNKFIGHFTLLGVRGGRSFGWYAELGYGYKGIVNAGLSVKL